MSYQLMAWASEQVTGSPTRKAVLMALANRTSHETGLCNPRIELICAETELGPTAVKTALKDLVEAGVISRKRNRRGDGSLGTYTYEFPSRDGQPGTPGDSTPRSAGDSRPGTPGVSLNQELHEPGTSEPEALAAVAAYDPKKGTKLDGRNLPWDVLVGVTQADEKVEAGQIAKALKLIRGYVVHSSSPQTFLSALTGETLIANQIRSRARLYRDRWPNVELTPTALAKNWARVVTEQPGRDLDTALEAAQRGIDSARRTA